MEKRINTNFVDDLKNRTKKQAVSIIQFLKTIPPSEEIRVIKYQLIKSATSTAANYRASCRAKSKNDFISKLGIVNEEADETNFWLELMEDLGYNSNELSRLKQESHEIMKIIAKSIATSRNSIKPLNN